MCHRSHVAAAEEAEATAAAVAAGSVVVAVRAEEGSAEVERAAGAMAAVAVSAAEGLAEQAGVKRRRRWRRRGDRAQRR